MRAKQINEFERGRSPKKNLDLGKEKISKDFDQHLEDLKTHKSREQKEREEEYPMYAFLYRPKFEPVIIDGEELHKKTIEIENLYQIDPLEKGDLMAIKMMEIRATAQGGDTKLALVNIPSWMHKGKTAYDEEISPELRKYIIENKRKAFG